MSIGDMVCGSVSVPVDEPRTAARVLAEAQEMIGPALRMAVESLPESMWRVCGYQFGWSDVRGRPSRTEQGKAVRPALVLAAARAVGGSAAAALPAAVAVELAHNFSLLHDDVMDGDATRRHRPTVWKVFGTPTAILAGDALLCLAFEVLAAAPSAGAAVRVLSEAVADLIGGQAADVAFESRTDVTVDECLAMMAGKTGALMGAAGALGAIAAGAAVSRVEALRGFGTQVGVAFQCVDDLLGIWGDPVVTGKPVHADLRCRKKSLPVVAALTSGRPAGATLAHLYHADAPLSDAELVRAAGLVDAAGGRVWAHAQARERLDRALRCLGEARPLGRAGVELSALAHMICDRDR